MLTDGDIDAMKMLDLDFDSSQMFNALRDTDMDIHKFKEEPESDQQQQQQQLQQQVSQLAQSVSPVTTPTTNGTANSSVAASSKFCFNESTTFLPNGTKPAHKIKVRKIIPFYKMWPFFF